LFDPTNNKNQSKIVIKRDWEDIWMGWEEIRWRKECGMGERQTKHTKTENIKKTKKSRTHHPKQNSSNVLSVSLLYQVYRLMVFQNQCFLSLCFYEDFGSLWGTLWGTILVKNQEKCVAKTGLREVVKRVRKKR